MLKVEGLIDKTVPLLVSLDLSANDQLSGFTLAQWGNRSSTGTLNDKPCGPHITIGLNKVSPIKEIIYKISKLLQCTSQCKPFSWSKGGTKFLSSQTLK